MPASSQFSSYVLQLRSHPLLDRPPFQLILSGPRLPADMCESEEVEGLWSPFATCFPAFGSIAAELDEARLAGMQLERKLFHSFL